MILLVAYLMVGGLYAVRTPAWQAPDEPAHYNYVAQVAQNGCCPVIEVGDWDSAYLDTLKAARFSPELLGRIGTIQYEDHQPPLYYLIGAVVFRLTDGSLIALRLLSVIMGAGIVAFAYMQMHVLLRARLTVALCAALIVAFIPQNLAILASVNNDSLAGLVIAATLYLLIRYAQNANAPNKPTIPTWSLGVMVGIGLITKVNTIFMVGLVPLVILIHWWIMPDRRVGALIQRLILFGVPALVIGGVWWIRNLGVYGFPDVFGLGRHNVVVVGQLRTADLIAQVGMSEYLRRGVDTTFTSFWGQFGWMGLFMPTWAYGIVVGFLGMVVGGAAILVALRSQPEKQPHPLTPSPNGEGGNRMVWGILILTVILAVLQYLYYNTEFVQFQGRYLYPALIPLAIFAALGLDGWRVLLVRIMGERALLAWVTPLIAAVFIPLSVFMIWRVIPQLAP